MWKRDFGSRVLGFKDEGLGARATPHQKEGRS